MTRATSDTLQSPAHLWRLWGLLGLGLLIHASFGWLLTLSVDEAHYMLYADKLDWSYFDHPPLVGWIQWPLVFIGAPDAVIRLIPQLLWLLSCLLAREIALSLYRVVPGWSKPAQRQAAGLWAVALILLAPLMHVLAVGLLPDTLLMLLTLCLMWVVLRLAQTPTLTLWTALGVLLGLAGLAKYTAILPALAIILIVLMRHGFRILRSPGPWLALTIASLLVIPVFYWNARHDWISFVYQINHGAGGTWQFRRLAAFIGIQVVAYGPLLILGSILAARHIFERKAVLAGSLLLFFLIPFLVTAYLSGGGGSLPHWTGPAWLAITPFAANALAQYWFEAHHALIKAFVRAQAIICILAFAMLFFVGIPGISQDHAWGKKNPIADLWGWGAAGAQARKLAQNLHIDSISVSNWTLASRMAWYSRPTKVYVLDDRFDQFDLWFGDIPAGSDSIFVNWSQMRFDLPTGTGRFESCALIDQLDIMRLGRTVSDFSFYHCRNWGAAVAPLASGKTP
jgi:4-amino-4-deoxy-L-arabinose transferase-like glycosyltransferase